MRKVRLPELGPRANGAIALAIVVVCVAVGTLMRASLTDYNAHPEEVESLPYAVRPAWDQALSLDASADAFASADVVVVATCHGNGTYVYQVGRLTFCLRAVAFRPTLGRGKKGRT